MQWKVFCIALSRIFTRSISVLKNCIPTWFVQKKFSSIQTNYNWKWNVGELFVDLAMFIWNLFILILYIKSEKRTVSPHRFPLPLCGYHVKRSSTLNSSSSKQQVRHFWTAECRIQSNTYDDIKNITFKLYSQYSSEPRTRRSTSLSLNTERARTRDTEQCSGKNERFYKALLSFGKSRKDPTFYKYLDENWEHITEER